MSEPRHTVSPSTAESFLNWFSSRQGREVLDAEAELLCLRIRRFHGDTMLWLGPTSHFGRQLESCMVRHKVFGQFPVAPADGEGERLGVSRYVGDLENLPFAPGAMDGVVLHHGLDHAKDARSTIREVARVVRPGGNLLVFAFNPHSLWGLRSAYARFVRDPFRGAHMVTPFRLLDWLSVLGFDVDEPLRYLLYRPPFGEMSPTAFPRLKNVVSALQLPVGGVYSVLARKRAVATPPMKLKGKFARPALIPLPFPNPTARQSD